MEGEEEGDCEEEEALMAKRECEEFLVEELRLRKEREREG